MEILSISDLQPRTLYPAKPLSVRLAKSLSQTCKILKKRKEKNYFQSILFGDTSRGCAPLQRVNQRRNPWDLGKRGYKIAANSSPQDTIQQISRRVQSDQVGI